MELVNKRVCRTCMVESSKMHNIYDCATKDSSESIAGLLSRKVPHLFIQLKDVLPKYICMQCLDILIKWTNFQEICLETQRKFLELMFTGVAPHSANKEETIIVNEVGSAQDPLEFDRTISEEDFLLQTNECMVKDEATIDDAIGEERINECVENKAVENDNIKTTTKNKGRQIELAGKRKTKGGRIIKKILESSLSTSKHDAVLDNNSVHTNDSNKHLNQSAVLNSSSEDISTSNITFFHASQPNLRSHSSKHRQGLIETYRHAKQTPAAVCSGDSILGAKRTKRQIDETPTLDCDADYISVAKKASINTSQKPTLSHSTDIATTKYNNENLADQVVSIQVSLENVTKIVEDMQNVMMQNFQLQNHKSAIEEPGGIAGFNFPLRSLEEVSLLEEHLKEDAFKKESVPLLTIYFSRFKVCSNRGNNGNLTCKAVLDAFISPDAQHKYFSWSGRPAHTGGGTITKAAFKSFENVLNLLYFICSKAEQSYSISSFSQRVRELLKTSRSRTEDGKQISKIIRNKRSSIAPDANTQNLLEDTQTCSPSMLESPDEANEEDADFDTEY